ncbi:MAG: DHH family phosphoesterase, partial [Sphaerochaetaceae bacterium]
MEWKKKPVAVEDVRKLNERFGVDYLTASLLARRGITNNDQIKFYLETDIQYLHNPFLFEEMEMFVDRITAAVEEHEKVWIYGDRDVDGITATVLLKTELENMGIETFWSLPNGDEPYGLGIAAIDRAYEQGVTLAITVDCGISNHEEIEYARSLGIDVLITDHHIAGDVIPGALAVIDPKLTGCGYPFAHLAGCGVVAKCVWALRFSKTDLYQEELLFLHAMPGNTEPGNETVIIEAVRMKNMLVEDRIREEIVPGLMRIDQSRLVRFLDRQRPIFAFDVDTEQSLLARAFGSSIEIALVDIQALLEQSIEQITGKSLFNLKQHCRSIQYLDNASELDVLIAMFNAYVLKKHTSLSKDFESLLDLVAVGTIADLMPMTDENRIMVRKGLSVLSNTGRTGLRALTNIQNLTG